MDKKAGLLLLSYMFSGEDVPRMDAGPQMTPSADGKGLLLTHTDDIFTFSCEDETNCLWTMMDIKLKNFVTWHKMFTVPESFYTSDC